MDGRGVRVYRLCRNRRKVIDRERVDRRYANPLPASVMTQADDSVCTIDQTHALTQALK